MKLWAWDEKNLPSITHAIRTAVAATTSVIIARFVQMPEAYWAGIATLVVMQSTVVRVSFRKDRIPLREHYAYYHRPNSALRGAMGDRFA